MVVLLALVDQSLGAPRDQRLSTNMDLKLSDKQNPVQKSPSVSFVFFYCNDVQNELQTIVYLLWE